MAGIDDHAFPGRIDRCSIGHRDVHGILAIRSRVRHPAWECLRNPVRRSHIERHAIRLRRIVGSARFAEGRLDRYLQCRLVVTRASGLEQHGLGTGGNDRVVFAAGHHGRKAGANHRRMKRHHAQTVVARDDLGDARLVAPFDHQPQRAVRAPGQQRLARHIRWNVLIRVDPLSTGIAIFIRRMGYCARLAQCQGRGHPDGKDSNSTQ